jgi:hypothetical protein
VAVKKIVPFKVLMDTVAGTQDILATAPGDDCIGAVAWWSNVNTWANAPATTQADSSLGFGVMDATRQKAVYAVGLDGRNSNSLSRNRGATASFVVMNKTQNGNVEAEATAAFSNGGTDKGITLTWVTNPSDTWVMEGLLFFGTGTAVYADEQALPNGLFATTYDPGFEADAVFYGSAGNNVADAAGFAGNIALGFAQNVTGFPQRSVAVNYRGGVNPLATAGVSNNQRVLHSLSSAGAVLKEIEITSFTAGGGTSIEQTNRTGNASGIECLVFAWQWDDAARRAMVEGSPTPASGDYVEAGLAAEPDLVVALTSAIAPADENTIQTTVGGDQGCLSVALFDGAGFESAIAVGAEDNEPGNTNCHGTASDTRMMALRNGPDDTTLLDSGANPTIAMQSGGWTITAPTTTSVRSAHTLNIEAVAGGPAQHSIAGAVTVTPSVAAQMVEGRTLAGAVTVTAQVAAAMLEGRVLAGAVAVAPTVAATTAYNRNAALAGAVTVTPSIAATLDHTLNAAIAGAVTVTPQVAAGRVFQGGNTILGAVTVAPSIAALLARNVHPALAGSLTLVSVVGAAMAYSASGGGSIAGFVAVTPGVAAGLALNIHPALTGALLLEATPAALGMIHGGSGVTLGRSRLDGEVRRSELAGAAGPIRLTGEVA